MNMNKPTPSSMGHDGTDAYNTGDHAEQSATGALEAARKKKKKDEEDALAFKEAGDSVQGPGSN